MSSNVNEFIRMMKHPLKFRMYLLSKLPSAYFSGVRLKDIDEKKCIVAVPYKWFSRNPFRSTYFACLSMAAEMSTGALCLVHLHNRRPPVSMLVVKVESEYFKKAKGKTTFTCEDGEMIKNMIDESVKTGEAKIVRARSTGINDEGQLIAEVYVTWSFKPKSK
jgi:hypothetical protein